MVDVAISRGDRFEAIAQRMFAELFTGDRGTHRALPFHMHGTASFERINGEQIATRTDLLLARARAARCRLSSNKAAFAHDVRVLARGSQPSIPMPVLRAAEPTLLIRVQRAGTSTTTAAILATVFAIAIVLTSIL